MYMCMFIEFTKFTCLISLIVYLIKCYLLINSNDYHFNSLLLLSLSLIGFQCVGWESMERGGGVVGKVVQSG